MLTIATNTAAPRCDGLARRDFIQAGALGLGGLTLAGLLPSRAAASAGKSFLRDKSIVLLFLAGGPSQYETFDPKPDGLDSSTSIAGHIGTALPGVRFASYFPKLAERAKQLTIVRSLVAKTANHAKASKNMLTGGIEDPEGKEGTPVSNPSLGALLAQARGASDRRTGMPTYGFIPPIFETPQGLKIAAVGSGVDSGVLGSGGGNLGAAFAPFNPLAGGAWADLLKPRLPVERLDARRDLLTQFDHLRRTADETRAYEELDAMQQQAYDVLLGGAIRKALDLSQEDPPTLARYDTGHCRFYGWDKANRWIKEGPSTGFPLGKQMLLARRMCEAGSRFVTVVHSNWDMHGGEAIWGMKDGMEVFAPPTDHAVAAFIDDLEERGLSKDILLIVVGEFGRSAGINKVGGREHNPNAGVILFAGGGLKHGQVVGATDKRGGKAVEDIVTVDDLSSTVLHYLFDIGELRASRTASPELKKLAVDHGQPIRALFPT
jgi:hypothetical protein